MFPSPLTQGDVDPFFPSQLGGSLGERRSCELPPAKSGGFAQQKRNLVPIRVTEHFCLQTRPRNDLCYVGWDIKPYSLTSASSSSSRREAFSRSIPPLRFVCLQRYNDNYRLTSRGAVCHEYQPHSNFTKKPSPLFFSWTISLR